MKTFDTVSIKNKIIPIKGDGWQRTVFLSKYQVLHLKTGMR